MMIQKDLIRSEDWDCLIILDACRYDYFERVYDDYLTGELVKVQSIASDTPGWLCGTFMDEESFDDVVYVSANPFVNSKGRKLIEEFDATEHFEKIVDVWDWKFNLKYMTVLPENMGKATRLARAKYPRKRLISHFMQPHWPYLSKEPFREALPGPLTRALKKERNKNILDRLGEFIEDISKKVLGGLRTRRIKDELDLRYPDPEELFAEKYGKRGLRKAYEENLRLVLEEVVKVVEKLPGEIIVTADHGEFLGERDLYSHLAWSNDPILREVPWLEVEK